MYIYAPFFHLSSFSFIFLFNKYMRELNYK